MPVWIAGLGTAVPEHRIAQADAATIARQYSCETPDHDRVFHAVYWGTGVETRHSVVLQTSTGDPAARQSFYGDASPTTRESIRDA
jgi:predicted naringenin-chalcone synthase